MIASKILRGQSNLLDSNHIQSWKWGLGKGVSFDNFQLIFVQLFYYNFFKLQTLFHVATNLINIYKLVTNGVPVHHQTSGRCYTKPINLG